MAKNFEITCPCCEATIVVDRISGDVLLHRPRVTTGAGNDLEAMVSQLETKRTEAAKRFERELESQKDRARLLDEKFKEAMARVDKSDKPPVNPFDLD
ncbi:MAG TPA: 2-nitropropane dioxygenase [Thermoanaerobaculia bacterium]|nr:2-nitropropane dioxygenase [Thermoanaerobaculia bacterium]